MFIFVCLYVIDEVKELRFTHYIQTNEDKHIKSIGQIMNQQITAIKKMTKGFRIHYPDKSGYGKPTLFKVYFGRKYLIWKGKSFYQSIEILGQSIRSCMNKGNTDDTNFMYHVVSHIMKNKIDHGECFEKDLYSDFSTPTKELNGFKLLVAEQEMIDEAISHSLCLNNNVQAYVPDNTAYLSKADKERFLAWYYKTHK